MYESISKNNELENEMTLDMSYFWYSDVVYSCMQDDTYDLLHRRKNMLYNFVLDCTIIS